MFLILFPYKFTNFRHKLYNIEELKSKLGQKVEVHDLSEVLNKKWNSSFLTKRQKGVKIFYSLISWIKYFNNLKKNEKLTVLNFLDTHSFKSLFIHYILFKANIKILRIFTPGICTTENYQKWSLTKKKIIRVIFEPKRLLIYLRRRIINFILFKCNFKRNFILYSGYKKINPIKNENDTYVKFHSFEYSKYLLKKKNLKKTSNIILFLDSAGPFFKSDLELFGYNIKIDKKIWYSEINDFFKRLEKKLNCKIFIVPHPKNKGVKNPMYDKSFKFLHEQDAALNYVPKAKLVLANSPTTALAYAVAYDKKIIMFYNDQILNKDFTRHRETKFISKILKLPFVNISKKFELSKCLKPVNKKLYDDYKIKYLTSKSISNKMNFEILKEIANK